MVRLFVLLAFCLFCASCARMLNTRLTAVNVGSSYGTLVTIDTSTQEMFRNKRRLFVVKRDSLPLKIILRNDSLQKEFYIKPILSRTVYFNVLNAGIGYLHDRHSLKRYAYPQMIWVGMADTGNVYYKTQPPARGMVSLNISVPFINQFYLRTGKGQDQADIGIFGLSIGGNYWHLPLRFLSVQGGIIANVAPVEYPGVDTVALSRMKSIFLNVRQNYNLGMFDVGYGLAFSRNTYDHYLDIRTGTDRQPVYTERYLSYGLAFSFAGYYHIGRFFVAGLLYQPQFLSFSDGLKLYYGHSVSLDFMFRIPVAGRGRSGKH